MAAPTFTVGVGTTTTFLLAATDEQGFIPVVVSVKVAVPLYPAGGVHVAFRVFASGLNAPPCGLLHVPPVALPPTEPPNKPVVPP